MKRVRCVTIFGSPEVRRVLTDPDAALLLTKVKDSSVQWIDGKIKQPMKKMIVRTSIC